jgi:hypothetical protein
MTQHLPADPLTNQLNLQATKWPTDQLTDPLELSMLEQETSKTLKQITINTIHNFCWTLDNIEMGSRMKKYACSSY